MIVFFDQDDRRFTLDDRTITAPTEEEEVIYQETINGMFPDGDSLIPPQVPDMESYLYLNLFPEPLFRIEKKLTDGIEDRSGVVY